MALNWTARLGLIAQGGKITEAAPILKWAIGKTDNELRAYCARKSWRVREISEHLTQIP
ncbi:hypothetical protein ABIF65_004147 [Bradyrhizobium japonicum]|jgi:hypothetical protein|nr:hypothetical protein [Bradyrhizobium japonicum]MCP1858531.1 hypothetical protein [Bradyrhizobium japonicum]MCP1889350.1 hypothetical protein [Bradyrhizobium japonicum]MCW2322328.1 hypothetical protein [Bradyrhizobium japonicum]